MPKENVNPVSQLAGEMKEKVMSRVKVMSNGCWQWTGAITKHGYGSLPGPGKPANWKAHRLSYLIFKGEIPEARLEQAFTLTWKDGRYTVSKPNIGKCVVIPVDALSASLKQETQPPKFKSVSIPEPKNYYKCFGCKEVFVTDEDAEKHFGKPKEFKFSTCVAAKIVEKHYARINELIRGGFKELVQFILESASSSPLETPAATELIVGDPRGRCLKGGKLWCCSLPKNHEGDHKAYYSHDLRKDIMDIWPAETASPAPADTGAAACHNCAGNAKDNAVLADISELVVGYREASAEDILVRVQNLVKNAASTGDTPQPQEALTLQSVIEEQLQGLIFVGMNYENLANFAARVLATRDAGEAKEK